MAFDFVGGVTGVASGEGGDGGAEGGASGQTVGDEAALVGLPGVGEEVEAFEKSLLGVVVELGCAT